MFGYIPTSDLAAKAAELVAVFGMQASPEGMAAKKNKPAVELQVRKALDQLFILAREYCQKEHLGVIGRARFGRALQRELHRYGYAPEIVSRVTTAVTLNALIAPKVNK